MKREPFVQSREARWEELEKLLDALDATKGRRANLRHPERLPELYRKVCQDLALAKHRNYDSQLVRQLNRLALRGHHRLYKRPAGFGRAVLRFVASGFPRVVRAHGRAFGIANLLFYGPFLALMACVWIAPDWIYTVVGPAEASLYEEMYDPAADRLGRGRDSGSDFQMFGFYIYNNVGIAFRTFAGGVLFGVGTLFFLLYNGVMIGGVFAHLTRIGYHVTLFPFVVGHGAFELTAIVLSGAAGLMLGGALVAPGRRSRRRALVESGRDAMQIMTGAFGMLVIAAFIEGFWSPSSASASAKYAVGLVLWVAVGAYFLFAGRSDGPR